MATSLFAGQRIRCGAVAPGTPAPRTVSKTTVQTPAFATVARTERGALACARAAQPSGPPVVKTNAPMNVVFISAEVAPWSKTGGLGDVVGGLPIELAKRGHTVMTIAPRCGPPIGVAPIRI